MIAEAGLAALWLAAALALVQLVERRVAVAHTAMAAIAAAALFDSSLRSYLLVSAAMLAAVTIRSSFARRAAVFCLSAYAALLLHLSDPVLIGLGTICLALSLVLTHRRRRWSRRALSANIGLIVALLGGALMAVGALGSVALSDRKVAIARPGERVDVGPWLVEFATLNPVAGPDYTAVEAELRATRGSGVTLLHPQARTLIAPRAEESAPATTTMWDGRLTALVAPAGPDRWMLTLTWAPLVTLIPAGGLLIALAGLILFAGRGWRWRRRRERAQ